MRLGSVCALAVAMLGSVALAGCGGDKIDLAEVESGIKTDLAKQIRERAAAMGATGAGVGTVNCVKKGEDEARCLAEITGGDAGGGQLPINVTFSDEEYIWEAEGGDSVAALAAALQSAAAPDTTGLDEETLPEEDPLDEDPSAGAGSGSTDEAGAERAIRKSLGEEDAFVTVAVVEYAAVVKARVGTGEAVAGALCEIAAEEAEPFGVTETEVVTEEVEGLAKC